MVDCDYNDIEGVGVKPDIEVLFNWNTLRNNQKDLQLNAAVDHIRKATREQ